MATKIVLGARLDLENLPGDHQLAHLDLKPHLDQILEEYGGSLAGGFEIVVEGDRRNISAENMEYYLSLKFPEEINLRRLAKWIDKIKNTEDIEDKFNYLMKRLGQGEKHHDMVMKSVFYF